MEARITIVGNIVADAEIKQKDEKTTYHYFRVAVNRGKDKDPKFYTCFVYGVSEKRAKHLVTGTMVHVYGIPDETINTNPTSQQPEINRTISVKDLEILITKQGKGE